jgi:hypothetical protein
MSSCSTIFVVHKQLDARGAIEASGGLRFLLSYPPDFSGFRRQDVPKSRVARPQPDATGLQVVSATFYAALIR